MTVTLNNNLSETEIIQQKAIRLRDGLDSLRNVEGSASVKNEQMDSVAKEIERLRQDFGYLHPNTLGYWEAHSCLVALIYQFNKLKGKEIVMLSDFDSRKAAIQNLRLFGEKPPTSSTPTTSTNLPASTTFPVVGSVEKTESIATATLPSTTHSARGTTDLRSIKYPPRAYQGEYGSPDRPELDAAN